MKNLLLLVLLAGGVFLLHRRDSMAWGRQSGDGAKFAFEQEIFDFGKVAENVPAVHLFTFKNEGNRPLIIETVSASCGCTTPDWPKNPILPGKSGAIKVTFDTKGRPGSFVKEVFVKSNDVGDQPHELQIKGSVIPKKTQKK